MPQLTVPPVAHCLISHINMIITESEHSEGKAPSAVRSGDSEVPPSPPPYTPTMSSTSFGADEKPLPSPPFSPPGDFPDDHDSNFSAGPAPPSNLPPRCNNLVERNQNSSVKGIWHVDTALSIPEALLAPLDEFDGTWNEADQKARKERRKLEKKGKCRSGASPIPDANVSTRPNLMVHSKNGAVSAEVHVVSSDGYIRPATIVAESHNGSVTLEVRTYAEQPLRIFATSHNGSVRVRIPQSFEGAVTMSTQNGSTKISESVKSHLTTFSSASNTTRGFIGDWQSAQFGTQSPSPRASPSDPNADPPLPTISDPFAAWNGPLVHIASRNGGVQLAFSDEEPPASGGGGGVSSAFRGFMSGLFGGGEEGEAEGSQRGVRVRGGGPWGPGAGPWGPGAGPWGPGAGPWGPGGGPWGARGGPWGGRGGPWGGAGAGAWGGGRGFGPFGPSRGPFGHVRGPFGRGGGPFGPGGFGGGCSSRRNEGPSDEKDAWPSDDKDPAPLDDSASNYQDEHKGESWIGMTRHGFPEDKKD